MKRISSSSKFLEVYPFPEFIIHIYFFQTKKNKEQSYKTYKIVQIRVSMP